METSISRALRLAAEMGLQKQVDFAAAINATSQIVSNWKTRGAIPADRLIDVAQALGCTAEYLATGVESSNRPQVQGGAHHMDPTAFTVPPTIAWEDLMGLGALPARFVVAVPDDALAPATPAGSELIFETASADLMPKFGQGVLIVDRSGAKHVRRCTQAKGGGWAASARNDAYVSFQPGEFELLAVSLGRLSMDV